MNAIVSAYAASVKPLGPARLVNGFAVDPSNPASVTEVELPNGRIGYQVGPLGRIFASRGIALVHAEERRAAMDAARVKAEAEAFKAAAEVEVKAAPVYPAERYANAILGELSEVSTEAQKNFAYEILCSDWIAGKTTEGVGPSLEALRELNAARSAAPAPIVRKRQRKVNAAKLRRLAVCC